MQNIRTYSVDIAKALGINAAILLNQIIYWQSKSKNSDKSFYKLDSEWATELGMTSVWVVRRAKKKLIDAGYIDTNYRLHNNKRTTVIYFIRSAVLKDYPDIFSDKPSETVTKKDKQRSKANTSILGYAQPIQKSLSGSVGSTLPEHSKEAFRYPEFNDKPIFKKVVPEIRVYAQKTIDEMKAALLCSMENRTSKKV